MNKSILIASAAATLFLSGAVVARAEQKAGADEVRCAGINACKGQGIVKASAADCKSKGGTAAPEPKK